MNKEEIMNMEEIMRRIKASQPAHLAGDGHVDPDVRRMELNRAFAQPRMAATKRRGRKWLLVPGAAGLAGAVAVGLVAISGGTAAPKGPAGQATLSGQSVFLAAASNAERQPMGRYWRSDVVDGQLYEVPATTGAYAIIGAGAEYFQWTAAKTGGGSLLYGRDLPARLVTADDVAAWHRAGSPNTFRVWSNDHYQTFTRKVGTWSADMPRPGGRFMLFGKTKAAVTVEDLQNLPTDPAKLAALMFSPESTASPLGDSADKILRISATLQQAPIPPKVRAAMMRMLAAQPGVRSIGTVTDPLGRKGVALAATRKVRAPGDKPGPAHWRDLGFVTSEQLIFDKDTGEFLAEQEVLVKPGGIYRDAKPGTVINYWAARTSGWTNMKPTPPQSVPFS